MRDLDPESKSNLVGFPNPCVPIIPGLSAALEGTGGKPGLGPDSVEISGQSPCLKGLPALTQVVERLTRSEKFPSHANRTTRHFSPTTL